MVTVGCVFALLSLVNAQSLPNVVLVGVKPEKRLSVLGKLSSAGSKALDTLRKEGFLVREKSGIVVIIDKTSSPFAALDRTRAQIDVFARPGVESGVLEWSSLSSAERDSLVTRLELLAGAKLQSFKGSIALSASPVVLIQIGGRVVTDVTLGVDPIAAEQERLLKRSPAKIERSQEVLSASLPPSLDFLMVPRTLPRSALLDAASDVVRTELETAEKAVDDAARKFLERLGIKDGRFGRARLDELPAEIQDRLAASVSAKPERYGFSNSAEAVAALRQSRLDFGVELGLTYYDPATGGFRVGAVTQVWK